MSKTSILNAPVPPGSLVLVTAANGLVASHVADQFLTAGYRVRGTVRNKSKNEWLTSLFDARYGNGRFELMEIPDIFAPDAWIAAVKDVAGIAHVFGAADVYTQDFEAAAEKEFPSHIALLEAARNESTVKSFVFTSSAWAASSPVANKKRTLTEWSWNEDDIALARSDASPEQKYFANYMALKSLLEQRIWGWVKKEKLPFSFNTILLSTVFGPTLHPKDQGMPSTAGMVKWAFDGINTQILAIMPPQWCVDTRDAGMLYVAALTTPGVSGERLFAFGDRYSWAKVIEILGKLFPGKDLPSLPDSGWDQTEVPNLRSGELLNGVKQSTWTSLEESVKAGSQCF
ncbi:hypothetical protein BP5796_01170 [Coleophoma crateriformis]|uniref:NAD-dependent epimerase/dehydratase domain-containing protein n=1 Tax=Coleophoma crateriformis TaxID=565419 RepID=A0A3D8SZP9_9HELO|nr:hypothetical protein BP5796_01170 [Coleophoma crateriformis]